MHFRSKWKMQGHFKHLNFEAFPMVSWRGNFMFVFLFNQGSKYLRLSYECNSQCKSAFRNHWAQFLALSPTCESVLHSWTHSFGITCPCTPHLTVNPILRLQHYKNHPIIHWATWKKTIKMHVTFLIPHGN